MAVIHATTEEFRKIVKENRLVLVDFFATWCGPCKIIAPFIEQVAEEYQGEAKVLKIDIDEEQELAEEFGIESIPTVMLFKDGAPLSVNVGAHQKDFYSELIENQL